MARSRHYFLLPAVLTVRLTPHSAPPNESWAFELPSGQAGLQLGSLLTAARGVRDLARFNGHPAVDLVLPRAGLWGVFSRRIRLVAPGDERQLIGVDVEALRRRHGARAGSRPRRSWRAVWAARVARVARLRVSLPTVWPAVP